MNLILGATRMAGSEICRLLTAGGKPVKAMVRETSDRAKVAELAEPGASIVKGDLPDDSTFEIALHGVTTVITTLSSMPFSCVPGENDIEIADMAGIKNLINLNPR